MLACGTVADVPDSVLASWYTTQGRLLTRGRWSLCGVPAGSLESGGRSQHSHSDRPGRAASQSGPVTYQVILDEDDLSAVSDLDEVACADDAFDTLVQIRLEQFHHVES